MAAADSTTCSPSDVPATYKTLVEMLDANLRKTLDGQRVPYSIMAEMATQQYTTLGEFLIRYDSVTELKAGAAKDYKYANP